MADRTRSNNYVFSHEQEPLFTAENAANIIIHDSFTIVEEGIPIWTPSLGKSISLAAVQASAPLGVTITLSKSDSEDFLALRVTEQFTAVSQRFPSPVRIGLDVPIFVSTSDEEENCEEFAAEDAVQVDFNGRSDFNNVANAESLADGQLAALPSGLLAQTRGRIVLDYEEMSAAFNNVQIESVVLKFYCRLNMTQAVGTSFMTLFWRLDPGDDWTELQQFSISLIGELNFLANPVEHDITAEVLAEVDPWEVIDNLQTSFVGLHTGLGLGNVIQLDAVEIEICVIGENSITLFGFET